MEKIFFFVVEKILLFIRNKGQISGKFLII
jgi:hypothetical protein